MKECDAQNVCALAKTAILVILLSCCQYLSAAQHSAHPISGKSYDCASDSLTWEVIKSLKKSGIYSMITLCTPADGLNTTESSTYGHIMAKTQLRKFSGCTRIHFDTLFTRHSDSSFSFYHANKINSFFTHQGLGHDDCKDTCFCSIIVIFLPGESHSYLSKKCSIEHQNVAIQKNNSGISREEGIQLLQKWMTLIKDH